MPRIAPYVDDPPIPRNTRLGPLLRPSAINRLVTVHGLDIGIHSDMTVFST